MSFDTTQSELRSLFSEVGEVVDVFVPTDRDTGRPRGFAFVEFHEEAAATEAINRFNGYELQGRNLRVSEAQERERRSPNFSDVPTFGAPRGPRKSKAKGSRRNIRSRKRGF